MRFALMGARVMGPSIPEGVVLEMETGGEAMMEEGVSVLDSVVLPVPGIKWCSPPEPRGDPPPPLDVFEGGRGNLWFWLPPLSPPKIPPSLVAPTI